jgi:hypothetical protein
MASILPMAQAMGRGTPERGGGAARKRENRGGELRANVFHVGSPVVGGGTNGCPLNRSAQVAGCHC